MNNPISPANYDSMINGYGNVVNSSNNNMMMVENNNNVQTAQNSQGSNLQNRRDQIKRGGSNGNQKEVGYSGLVEQRMNQKTTPNNMEFNNVNMMLSPNDNMMEMMKNTNNDNINMYMEESSNLQPQDSNNLVGNNNDEQIDEAELIKNIRREHNKFVS